MARKQQPTAQERLTEADIQEIEAAAVPGSYNGDIRLRLIREIRFLRDYNRRLLEDTIRTHNESVDLRTAMDSIISLRRKYADDEDGK